jgi:hypothetical protein
VLTTDNSPARDPATLPLPPAHLRLTPTPAPVEHAQGGLTLGLEEGELDADFCHLGGTRLQRSAPSSPPTHPLRHRFYQHSPRAGELKVSGGRVEGESNRGDCLHILRARRSKPKMAALIFWRPFQDSCRVAMVEPPVSYLEPHGPRRCPPDKASQLGLLAALVWASSYAISSTTVDSPTQSPPDRHRHGKKKDHSRRARSSRRSERLPKGGAPGRRQPSRQQ